LDFTQAALRRAVLARGSDQTDVGSVDLAAEPMAGYRARFVAAISEDLGLPAALAVAHGVAAADDLTPGQRRALLLDFDRVFGLGLDEAPEGDDQELPEGVAALLEQRASARDAHDYATSDRLRDELAAMGVEVRERQPARRRPAAAEPVHGRAAQCGAVRAGDHWSATAVRPCDGGRGSRNLR
jgi:cysteinyl-tRNA synthetase